MLAFVCNKLALTLSTCELPCLFKRDSRRVEQIQHDLIQSLSQTKRDATCCSSVGRILNKHLCVTLERIFSSGTQNVENWNHISRLLFQNFLLLVLFVGQRLCIDFSISRASFLTTLHSHLDVTC